MNCPLEIDSDCPKHSDDVHDNHIFEFDTPLQIMDAVEADPTDPEVAPLIPVKIPIENVSATINTDEMIIAADVGADL